MDRSAATVRKRSPTKSEPGLNPFPVVSAESTEHPKDVTPAARNVDDGGRDRHHHPVRRKKFPDAFPRIVSDDGPWFIAKDFGSCIRICGMTYVRTSPYCPQSNGTLDRRHKSVKSACIRLGTPLSLADARRLVAEYAEHYNTVRLHSAVGCVTPNNTCSGNSAGGFS